MIILQATFVPPSLTALNAISEEEASANKLPSTGGCSALLKGTSELFQSAP